MSAVVESRIPGRVSSTAGASSTALLQIPLFGDENLLIQAWNIHPTKIAKVLVGLRVWSEETQDVQQISQSFSVPTTASNAVVQIPLQCGAILSMRISSDDNPPGNVWVRCVLSKGFQNVAAITFPATILQGYIGLSQDLAWPGSPIQQASDGPGVIRTVAGSLSAASFIFTVPVNRRWRIVTAIMALATDPTIGNRRVDVIASTVAAAVLFVSGSIAFQAANQSVAYSCSPGSQGQVDISGTRQMLPFPPDLPMRGGDTLQIAAVGVSGFDVASIGVATVREWYDPDTP